MYTIFATICGLVIILGFEIRHRIVVDELKELNVEIIKLDQEIRKLKEEVKLRG